LARERAVGRRGQALQHRALALRDVEGLPAFALAASDLAYDLGAPVEQRQNLVIDAVDGGAQCRQIVGLGTSGHSTDSNRINASNGSGHPASGSRSAPAC